MVKSKLSKVASVIYKISHYVDHSSVRTLCLCIVHYFFTPLDVLLWNMGKHIRYKLTMYYINTERSDWIDPRCQSIYTYNLFYHYCILKFTDIVELKTILFMLDAYHNVLPNDFHQLFVKYIPSYSTRRTYQFMTENVITNMRAVSIHVLGVTLWNSLNTLLVSITLKQIFKCHYINVLLSKYIM